MRSHWKFSLELACRPPTKRIHICEKRFDIGRTDVETFVLEPNARRIQSLHCGRMLTYAADALAYVFEKLVEVFLPRQFDPESLGQYAEKNFDGVMKQRRC